MPTSPVTLRTEHGDFTGRSVGSIIRRVYGRRAYQWLDMVVVDVHRGCHGITWQANVLAHIRRVYGVPSIH